MRKRKKNFVMIGVGVVCIAAALTLTGFNSWEDRIVSAESEGVVRKIESLPPVYDVEEMVGEVEAVPDYELHPEMEMPSVNVEGNDYIGTIQIPDLNINLPVLKHWNYDLLKINPCMYNGSIYTNDAIIMAHNYRSHFKQLWYAKVGMTVFFTDVDNNVFEYTISELETIPTNNLSDLLDEEDKDWDLTCFTCSYAGTSRTTIRCKRVAETE